MLVIEDEFHKIHFRQEISDRNSGSVLLSFTGIGHGMGGVSVQKPEFFGTGRSFDNTIFIDDKTRSWANSLNFDFIWKAIAPYVDGREIVSIGNSMGGYNAIISTHYIPTSTCISFVPQFSVNPEIVPWEKRWKNYTLKIKHFRFLSVAPFMNPPTKYFIFSGGIGLDFMHARLFPAKANIFHYTIHDSAHDVAKTMNESGLMSQAVQSCFGDNNDLPEGLQYDVLSPPVNS